MLLDGSAQIEQVNESWPFIAYDSSGFRLWKVTPC
jgi:hypothetical protein